MFTVMAMAISLYLLALALRTLPIGTGYAVWTGIGTVGAAILGILLFNESRDIPRILCIVLIIAGIIGLKLTSPE
jgi:quaternary ammonium compound-resistance protein SugE